MVSSRTLSPVLLRQLEEQLNAETQILLRIETLSSSLGENAVVRYGLADRQSEIVSLVDDLLHVQSQRQTLRHRVAADWNCLPEDVHLSAVQLASLAENERLHARRLELLQATARAEARLASTRESLAGWQGIVTELLAAVLPSPQADHVRYTASGQRVTPVHQNEIELRS